MNKLNLPPFYIGQKVVYITGYNMKKDNSHVVTSIGQWECGCWAILINNQPPSYRKPNDKYHCSTCYKPVKNNFLGWWAASSFRAVATKPLPLLTFEKIKETEKEEILILN